MGLQESITMITRMLMVAPRMKMGVLPIFLMMKPKPTEAAASQIPKTMRTLPTMWTP